MRNAFVLAAVLALGFAPAPLPKPVRADRPNLTGEWQVVSWARQFGKGKGQLDTGAIYRVTDGLTVRIGSGRLEFARDGSRLYHWTMSLHPAARPPRVDLIDSRTNATTLGIYRLQGDTLTICYRGSREDRPTDFDSEQQWTLVLKRKRP